MPIAHWCNNRRDVLEIRCDELALLGDLEEALEEMAERQGTRILRRGFRDKNVMIAVKTCACVTGSDEDLDSISYSIVENNCLEVPPIHLYDGWEHWKVISFDPDDAGNLIRDLGKKSRLEILSKKDLPYDSVRDAFPVSLGNLFSDLTDKQLEEFLNVLDAGYYEVPKRTTLNQIASLDGVPRTTFEEHVRKAESKILQALSPFVRLYAQSE